jgi:hypothetical protein
VLGVDEGGPALVLPRSAGLPEPDADHPREVGVVGFTHIAARQI